MNAGPKAEGERLDVDDSEIKQRAARRRSSIERL